MKFNSDYHFHIYNTDSITLIFILKVLSSWPLFFWQFKTALPHISKKKIITLNPIRFFFFKYYRVTYIYYYTPGLFSTYIFHIVMFLFMFSFDFRICVKPSHLNIYYWVKKNILFWFSWKLKVKCKQWIQWYLKSKKKNVSRIRKKTFYLQFCMGTPEGNEFAGWIQNPKILEHQINQSEQKFSQKKYVWYLKSVKEPNIHMEATRRNLRARLKILKKISDCKINQSKRKFSQKKYV
jgi:hypothetical protein